MSKGKIFIGTSGWVYSHWEGIFYPESLSSKDKLKYFSRNFKTVEVNYSFYHLPTPSTYQNWYSQTPNDFLFAIKASRFITHIKRLKDVQGPWKTFIKNALNLKEKLGPILFQFPSSFKATEENIKRLEEFLKLIRINQFTPLDSSRSNGASQHKSVALRFAFEFRHKSWCDPKGKPSASYGVNKKTYNLLKKYNAAWVIADSPRYPKAEEITADFVYLRLHGSKILFSSKYTKKELKDLTEKIKKWSNPIRGYKGKVKTQNKRTSNGAKNKDVYVYFNNDAYGYAVENAKTLIKFIRNK